MKLLPLQETWNENISRIFSKSRAMNSKQIAFRAVDDDGVVFCIDGRWCYSGQYMSRGKSWYLSPVRIPRNADPTNPYSKCHSVSVARKLLLIRSMTDV
ncbi:hypothetical protein TNIN_11761 [Trichonephila inaurata madagascariensis]|uniref:Uncharacterized protein n=1 Tax=Trichonephila inaurata madagascariensis TaxID=2747483 RepID=A0A8X7BRP6_9ARAC|nr:hypothetical protein TNIN_11761 [Trichonephila inaurata madagascariensis]